MLEAEKQAEILHLHFSQSRSVRWIASKVGVDRKTVKRVLFAKRVKLERSLQTRLSILVPHYEKIGSLLEKDPMMSAAAILQNIRGDGYRGGATIVREYVGRLKQRSSKVREAYLKLEFAPGECAQVDWGEFGDVFGDGVKIHCFIMVMAFSRMMYLEFTRCEKFEDFIRCHENAFKFFGGVPKECWYDNLASAVTERMNRLVKFNARFLAFLGHHCIGPHACNPARGNEKGRVESLVKFVRGQFWSGRSFKDFDDICTQAMLWRDQYANQREHRVTKRVTRIYFENEEKQHLRPYNTFAYETDEVLTKPVSSQWRISYDTNLYSVPWTLANHSVTVRISSNTVKMFYNEKLVASHVRSYLKDQDIWIPAHKEGLLERKPGANNNDWQISNVRSLGKSICDYVDLLRHGPRSLRQEVSRLLVLATVYGSENLDNACGALLAQGIMGVESLERFLKVQDIKPIGEKLIEFENQRLNKVIPKTSLNVYDAILFETKSESEDHES